MPRTLRQRKIKTEVDNVEPKDEPRKRKRVSSNAVDMPPLKTLKNELLQTKDDENKECIIKMSPIKYYTDDDLSDGETFEDFDSTKYQLSNVEVLRQENMKKNEEMLLEFNLAEVKHELSISTKPKKIVNIVGAESREERRRRVKEELANTPRRTSSRIRKIASDLLSLPPNWVEPNASRIANYEIRDEGRKPEEVNMETMNKIEEEVTSKSVKSWYELSTKISNKRNLAYNSCEPSFDEYKKKMASMTVHKIGKITKTRIFSTAFHPMEEKTLVAAGDKWGMVGLWDVDSSEDGSSELFWFQPHNRPINCLKFSPFDNTRLYSCSYDGSIRYADFEKQKFYQLYGFNEDENKRFNYFAWQNNNTSSILAASSFGHALNIDIRSGLSEQSFPLYQKSLRCLDFHPVNTNVVAGTCYDGTVATWDIRKLHEGKLNKPLSSFRSARTNTTCFFSPVTGNKLLLTSQDDHLRVFDINENGHIMTPPRIQIRHDNFTGRWLTTFRACWDPKTDNSFLCGSMHRPRQLDFYTVGDGKQYSHFSVQHEDFATVSSVNAFHPTKNILAGGNASGKMYIWA